MQRYNCVVNIRIHDEFKDYESLNTFHEVQLTRTLNILSSGRNQVFVENQYEDFHQRIFQDNSLAFYSHREL